MYKENKDITLQYYNQNAGSFVSGTVHADLTDTLNRFLSRLEPGAAILDFGCGSGRDTKYFLEHGYQVEAIDVLEATAVEEMVAGDYPLTLFTCTYGGKNRLTVRCGWLES